MRVANVPPVINIENYNSHRRMVYALARKRFYLRYVPRSRKEAREIDKAMDIKWCDKTVAGYPVVIERIARKKIFGKVFYIGQWRNQTWWANGKTCNDGSPMDVDLIPAIKHGGQMVKPAMIDLRWM